MFIFAASKITNGQTEVDFRANFELSDFSNFDSNGGVINVFFQSVNGVPSLPESFSLAYTFAPFDRGEFTYTDPEVSFDNLLIGVNESYSGVVVDTSSLIIEAAPEFVNWNLERRSIDQAGMALLGVWSQPDTNLQLFYETIFGQEDVTGDTPAADVFKEFSFRYENLVNPVIPASAVSTADYTVWTDTITYTAMAGLAGDFNFDGVVNDADIDILNVAIRSNSIDLDFDLNRSGVVDQDDQLFLVRELLNTFIGDSNLDGEFNSADLVSLFQLGEYEDGIPMNSSWKEGDWNGDSEFDSSDLVFSFQTDGYEKGPRKIANAVPEPKDNLLLISLAVLFYMNSSLRMRGNWCGSA